MVMMGFWPWRLGLLFAALAVISAMAWGLLWCAVRLFAKMYPHDSGKPE